MSCARRDSVVLRVARWWANRPFVTHVRVARWLRVWLHLPLRGRRRIIARNLQAAYPGLSGVERRALQRANLESTLLGVSELLRAWLGDADWFARHYRIEGLERIRAAQAQGRGVLLFTGHFTHYELNARAIGEALGESVRMVLRRNNSRRMQAFMERARVAVFGPSIEKKDVRGMLRVLEDGGLLMLLADQDFNYRHSFVPFFGIAAATLNSTPELVARTGAVMLPMWCRRDADGIYHVRIEEAWPGWSVADPACSAAIYMQALEGWVRAAPEQYLWMHRRFKTRIPGEPPFYR